MQEAIQMILIIDMSYKPDSLGLFEFVLPLANICKSQGHEVRIIHRTRISPEILGSAKAVILSGVALNDDIFNTSKNNFAWLKFPPCPVFGICAGHELITMVHGSTLTDDSEIGMTQVRVLMQDPLFGGREEFQAYELHNHAVVPPEEFLVMAESDACPQVIKHKNMPIYGVMFHPEVRNHWLLENFLAMADQ